jgi:hypothetical protein
MTDSEQKLVGAAFGVKGGDRARGDKAVRLDGRQLLDRAAARRPSLTIEFQQLPSGTQKYLGSGAAHRKCFSNIVSERRRFHGFIICYSLVSVLAATSY